MKLNSSRKFNVFRKALSIALLLATIVAPFSSIPFAPVQLVSADTAEMGQIIAFNNAGTFNWTAPSNVNTISVKVWGAGGAGGNGIKNDSDNSSGQGGGGGGYAEHYFSITPGSTHAITVGAGGSSTGGERNGGTSSFGSTVVATGGIGGANWDEIPNNHGNGGNNPQPTVVNTECTFEGTWVYHDEGGSFSSGDENDFAVTCRDSKLTGFCNIGIGKFGGVLDRGFHPGNYVCEQGVTPDVGTKCDFEGTWAYNDQGSGNDFAFTCRTGKVTGYCGNNSTMPRGVNPGIYSCEYGQPTTTDAPACNFSGTWEYNDEGSGNDFALTCQNNKMTTWCGTTNLNRGLNTGVFSCQAPTVQNNDTGTGNVGGWTKNLDIFDGVNHLIFNTIEFFTPAVAYAQGAYNGAGGTGTAGTSLFSGESASSITFVNGLPYASSGGAGYNGGAGGSRGRLGFDGAGDCIGFTCDNAQSGSNPGGGGGGSDTGFGGNGGTGYVLIQIMGVNTPNVDTDLPTTGHLDSADCNYISGWAYDPNASSTSIDVFLYTGSSLADGDFLATVTTDYPRPDVNAFAGITGVHGFMFPTPDSLKNGNTHQIFAYGVNTDPSHSYNNAQLHSPAPVFLSGCTNGGGGVVINTAPSAPLVSGPTSGVTGVDYTFSAVSNDPDNDQVRYAFDYNNDSIIDYYSPLGASGVSAQIVRNFPVGGTHNFHAYAEDNHGNRSSATLITIEIAQDPVIPNDPAPIGVLDSASCSVISGWAYDPSASSTSIDVHLYADGPAGTGTFLGGTTANISRPDVNTAESITGDHGFNFTTPDSLKDGGNHEIFAYGINTDSINVHNNNGLLASIGPVLVSGCTLGGGGGGNNAPSNLVVTGPLNGSINTSYAFTATAIDSDGDDIQYGFDWDNSGAIDGSEEWTPATLSGVSATRSNIWTTPGVKTFQVFARDTDGAQVSTSVNITISGGSANVGFIVTPTSGLETSESGATAVFTVVLESAPLADVTLSVTSSDTSEGTVSASSITFTPSNWNVSQTITVSGVNDSIVDGTIAYFVHVGPSTSADINFNNLPAQNVSVSNFDNDQAPNTGGGGSSGGGSSSGGGGSGYGAGGTCIGFNCSTGTGGSGNTGDITIYIDTPASSGGSGFNAPLAQDYCPADELITVYMRKDIVNNPNEVRKLQYFLNNYAGASLAIDGVFGTSTEDAVKAFQLANADAILSPWGVTEATGIVYITTTNAINRIFCGANPSYQGNIDLKDMLDGNVLENNVDNSSEFEGQIGANATSTNIAGLFGAVTQDILDFLKDIPWYAVLITLLTIIGTAIIVQSVFKKHVNIKANQMSFIQGFVTLSIASVLNVLNALSFIINPEWFTEISGWGISLLLGLIVLNLIAFLVIGGVIIAVIRRKSSENSDIL